MIPNTLKKYIITGKDTLKIAYQDVVYSISYHDHTLTKRQLKTRIAEYSSDINKKSGSLNVIFNHRILLNHNFD